MTVDFDTLYRQNVRRVDNYKAELRELKPGKVSRFTKEQLLILNLAQGIRWVVAKAEAGVISNDMPIWVDPGKNQMAGRVNLANHQQVSAARMALVSIMEDFNTNKVLERVTEVVNEFATPVTPTLPVRALRRVV